MRGAILLALVVLAVVAATPAQAGYQERNAAVICKVFGPHCQQAIRVARCESGLTIGAENGQYLGLFQMGSHERRLFGHGETARDQAVAAHRYFVRSGRDWSPWSCRWAAS
jgi:hypothetical protein